MSHKGKCDGAVGLAVCDFLSVFITTISPNSGPLRHISLRKLGDLDIGLSMPLKSTVMEPMDSPYVLTC